MADFKIAVTGGAGFIGTNLLHNLGNRYPTAELVSLDIREPAYPVPGVRYCTADVRRAPETNKVLEGATKLFHLAAVIGTHESVSNPYASFETNVQGTIALLEYAQAHDAELFVAGMPGIWNNPYSISKDAALRMAQAYHETYGTKVCALRWYSVYGPYQYLARYNKAVPTFVHKALHGEALPIYGDGRQVADFIYVDDATGYAIDLLEQKHWGKIVACSSGTGISVNDLAQTIIELCGSASTLQHLPMRPGEPPQAMVVADVTELRALFPDRQQMNLRAGLERTIEHYRHNPPLD